MKDKLLNIGGVIFGIIVLTLIIILVFLVDIFPIRRNIQDLLESTNSEDRQLGANILRKLCVFTWVAKLRIFCYTFRCEEKEEDDNFFWRILQWMINRRDRKVDPRHFFTHDNPFKCTIYDRRDNDSP